MNMNRYLVCSTQKFLWDSDPWRSANDPEVEISDVSIFNPNKYPHTRYDRHEKLVT